MKKKIVQYIFNSDESYFRQTINHFYYKIVISLKQIIGILE